MSGEGKALLGIVVIGRNEGHGVRAALTSAMRDSALAVYVDSGSTDNSATNAAEMGINVVVLDGTQMHTAARGRNAGFDWLQGQAPKLEYVQFLDGDCELLPGWTEYALGYLRDHPDVGVVAGRLRERERGRNIYHRLADMEWNVPPGASQPIGGIMMVRASAWMEVGGMNGAIVAGEELDLCLRLNAAGWRVMRQARDMALHDIGMDRFLQWWSRAERCGHAYAEGAWRRRNKLRPGDLRQLASVLVWGAGVPGVVLLTAPRALGLSLVAWSSYAWLATRVYRHRLERGESRSDAALYATSCVLAKFAQLSGAARFAWTLVLNAAGRHRSQRKRGPFERQGGVRT